MKTQYIHRISKTKRGSDQLGACEICHKSFPELFLFVEERSYFSPIKNRMSWTLKDCIPSTFGCKSCLTKLSMSRAV